MKLLSYQFLILIEVKTVRLTENTIFKSSKNMSVIGVSKINLCKFHSLNYFKSLAQTHLLLYVLLSCIVVYLWVVTNDRLLYHLDMKGKKPNCHFDPFKKYLEGFLKQFELLGPIKWDRLKSIKFSSTLSSTRHLIVLGEI